MKRIIVLVLCVLFTVASGTLIAAGKGDGGGRDDDNWQSSEQPTRGTGRAEQRRYDDTGMTREELLQREQEREQERERDQSGDRDGDAKQKMEQEQEREQAQEENQKNR